MMVTAPADAPEANTNRLRKALHRILDYLAVIAAISIILIFIRADNTSVEFTFAIVGLAALSVLPSVLLRADRHLHLRGALTTAGIQLPIFLGFISLVVNSAALATLPLFLALIAALFRRRIAYIAFAAVIGVLCGVGALMVYGGLTAVDISIVDWSRDPRSWYIFLFAFTAHAALLVLLTQAIRQFWNEKEEEARQSSLQFQALVEYAPDAIIIFDADKNSFVTANNRAAELYGMPLEELINGPTVQDLSPPLQPCGTPSKDLQWTRVKEALSGEQPVFEWLHYGPNRQEITCQVSLARMPPFDQALIRCSVVDITQRKAEQKERQELLLQLAKSQRLEAIGKLSGGLAHDFNNLLAIILGNLELYQQENGKSHDDLIQPCIDAALRGAALTNGMLSFARRAPLVPQSVNLNHLIRDMGNWSSSTFPENLAIQTRFAPGLWAVEADPSAAENAILNLLLNARDAMPEGGELRISTQNTTLEPGQFDAQNEALPPGAYVLVSVSDTGEGINPKHLPNVFDPFFTTKRPNKGSGLGLSMVQGFIRQTGGGVQIDSVKGQGTTIRLFFPASVSQHADLSAPQVPASPPPATGERILLVEDEEQVLKMLISTLKHAGFDVTPCINGDEAAQVFASSGPFDLLLTDIVMPGTLQGHQLARKLREQDQTLPVIFMSGYSTHNLAHDEAAWPNALHLTKPVLRRELLEAIQDRLAARHDEKN